MKKPTHIQMMQKPSIWYNEFLDCLKIVHPDIITQDTWENGEWSKSVNSTGVIRSHFEFLGWL